MLILPEVNIDDDLYDAATAGVATYLPQVEPLTWEQFTNPLNWQLIPDSRGELSKAEYIGFRKHGKVNIWFRPDLRGGEKPAPHNHPWEVFTGYVLTEHGYGEDRYWRAPGGGAHAHRNVQHEGPAANVLSWDMYHEVTDVHEPGKTISLMVLGQRLPGSWGYLDLDTGEHRRYQPVTNFDAICTALNKHLFK